MNQAQIQQYIADQLRKATNNLQDNQASSKPSELDTATQTAIAAGVEAGIRLATQGASSKQLQAGIQQAMQGAPQRQAETEDRFKSLRLAGLRAGMGSLNYSEQRLMENELRSEESQSIAAGGRPVAPVKTGQHLNYSEQLIVAQAELDVLRRFDKNPLRTITLLDNIRTLQGWIRQGKVAR